MLSSDARHSHFGFVWIKFIYTNHPMKIGLYSAIILVTLALALGCDDDDKSPDSCDVSTIINEASDLTYKLHYNNKNQITDIYNETLDGWEEMFTYNDKGNLEFSEHWSFTYDAGNRLSQIKSFSEAYIENYTYNEKNQMISATSINTDAGKPLTTYTYTFPNSNTLNFSTVVYSYGATETFEYDNNPNPFQSIWPQLGAVPLLYWEAPIYHTENNIKRSTYSEGTTTIVHTYHYVYNEKGYPTSINISSHVTTPTEEYTLTADPYAVGYDCK